MTLNQFLAAHSICRVWHVSHGSPVGCEVALCDDDDGYCDEQQLADLDVLRGAESIEGVVSEDADGEWRWEPSELPSKGGPIDCRGNTVRRLAVWGQKDAAK